MGNDAKATVTIVGRNEGSPAFKSAAKDLDDVATHGDRAHKSLQDLSEGLVAGAVANGVKNFLGGAITAASDLNETTSKTKAVFGDAADGVLKFGQNSAKSLGQSTQQALEASATFGNLFRNLGLTAEASAKMSTQLVTTATDLASFHNASPQEMLEALQSALAGEYDPLQRFGFAISAAAVQQEALREGLAKTPKDITPAIQAQASYGLILQQVGAAQGDFAKTSGGLANQQRILAAEFENAKANLGDALLPVMLKGVSAANDALEAFGKLPAPIRDGGLAAASIAVGLVATGVAVGKVKDALGELGDGLGAVRGKFVDADGASTRFGRGMSTLAVGVGAVGAALAATQVASAAFGQSASSGVNEATTALTAYARGGQLSTNVTKDLSYALDSIANGTWSDRWSNGLASVIESATGLGDVMDRSVTHARQELDSLDAGLANLVRNGHADTAAAAFKRLGDQAQAQGISLDRLRDVLPQYRDALAEAKSAADKHADSLQQNTDKAKDTKSALDQLSQSLDDSASKFLKGKDAEVAYWEAIDKGTKVLQENGNGLNLHTEKGRENQRALDDAAAASQRYIQSLIDQGAPQAVVLKALDDSRDRLFTLAASFSSSQVKAKEYVDQVLKVPTVVSTTVVANTAQATANLGVLIGQLAWVNGKQTTIQVSANAANVREGRAGGGWVAGAPSRVDSVLQPLAGGEFVVNSDQARQWGPLLEAINSGAAAPSAAAAAAGPTVVLNLRAIGNSELARVVVAALAEAKSLGYLPDSLAQAVMT